MSFIPSTTTINQNLNFIKNSTPYLALMTTAPTATTAGTEVSGGSYARKAISFTAPSAGSMSSSSAVSFTGMPKASVSIYAVYDAATGGNQLGYGDLNYSVATESGDQIIINAGDIVISVSGM